MAVDGDVVWHSISSYLPTPLEVLENPWVQWAVLLPRSIDGPEYDAIRDGAARGLRALGMGTGFTHMEWFRLSEGRIALSEVAARPPGAQFTSLLSYAHDTDMYAAWARLEIFGEFDPPERRHAVGAAYLRGQGQGVVRGVHGLDVLQRELGALVVEARLPARASRAARGTRVRGTSSCATRRRRGRRRRPAPRGRGRARRDDGLTSVRTVLMISPGYPAEMPFFVRGLASTGARVVGVGDQPVDALPADGA